VVRKKLSHLWQEKFADELCSRCGDRWVRSLGSSAATSG
jgi:hypothetical protein